MRRRPSTCPRPVRGGSGEGVEDVPTGRLPQAAPVTAPTLRQRIGALRWSVRRASAVAPVSQRLQADLRSLMGYVPQDPAMFHRTLRDNIAFARPGAGEAEIRRAAEAAHVTEFADALPEGFSTMVGERGVKLSGGQRQRVALARAILLLDEATSALDSESEILVQEALWRLMEGRTALVVAHRLSTVAGMDSLVVLDRGRIVEQGSHQELLASGGTYAKLWQHQSGGFLDDTSTRAADLR